MKAAVIDIGTNTTRLAIFSIDRNRKAQIIFSENNITRIGKGLSKSGIIDADSFNRTLEELKKYFEISKLHDVNTMKAVGTAALRKASNGTDFVEEAKKAGVEIEIISGTREGELVYKGVVDDYKPTPENLVVIDIGGGSTEIIFGGAGKTTCVKSVDAGAVSTTEMFLKNDPPLKNEIDGIRNYSHRIFSDAIKEMPGIEPGNIELAGVAGAITTICMIDLKLENYDADKVHGSILKKSAVKNIVDRLQKMTSAERKQIPGMEPGRADIIHAGAIMLECLMDVTNAEQITVSERDIRYGLLKEMT